MWCTRLARAHGRLIEIELTGGRHQAELGLLVAST
jgi:hypothetical protein